MADGAVFARVHVLVLCDEIERRPGTEVVYDLRRVRTGIQAASFPYTHPQLGVYLQVSGHEGTASGRIVAVNEATDEEIIGVPIDEIRLWGPLTIVHYRVQLQHCVFRAPGVYWFQVFLNQKLVAERRLHVEISGDTNGQLIR
jgi:hypothetical protein